MSTAPLAPHAMIIGGGIVGITTAAQLQRQGFRVSIIERGPVGEGCSFGNAGILAFADVLPTVRPRVLLKIPGWLLDPLGPLTIRPSYLFKALPWFLAATRNALPQRVAAITEARAALCRSVVDDHRELLKGANAADLMVERETLRVFESEAEFEAEAHERQVKAEHGCHSTIYSAGECREMEPELAAHIVKGATHGGWYFVRSPLKVTQAIAETVVRGGGEIIADEVTAIEVKDGKATALRLRSRGTLPVDRVVVTAGAYSNLLLKPLGEKIRLEAERGYHIELPDPGISLSRPITFARTPAVITPMEGCLRIAGTDEFAGLDAPENWQRADALYHNYKAILPGLKAPGDSARRWMGRRPGTPDSLPVIGPSTRAANLWYNFGQSHMGLSWAPTSARLLAQLMAGKKPSVDMSPYRADRF